MEAGKYFRDRREEQGMKVTVMMGETESVMLISAGLRAKKFCIENDGKQGGDSQMHEKR